MVLADLSACSYCIAVNLADANLTATSDESSKTSAVVFIWRSDREANWFPLIRKCARRRHTRQIHFRRESDCKFTLRLDLALLWNSNPDWFRFQTLQRGQVQDCSFFHLLRPRLRWTLSCLWRFWQCGNDGLANRLASLSFCVVSNPGPFSETTMWNDHHAGAFVRFSQQATQYCACRCDKKGGNPARWG